jgi:hypothetical protein
MNWLPHLRQDPFSGREEVDLQALRRRLARPGDRSSVGLSARHRRRAGDITIESPHRFSVGVFVFDKRERPVRDGR